MNEKQNQPTVEIKNDKNVKKQQERIKVMKKNPANKDNLTQDVTSGCINNQSQIKRKTNNSVVSQYFPFNNLEKTVSDSKAATPKQRCLSTSSYCSSSDTSDNEFNDSCLSPVTPKTKHFVNNVTKSTTKQLPVLSSLSSNHDDLSSDSSESDHDISPRIESVEKEIYHKNTIKHCKDKRSPVIDILEDRRRTVSLFKTVKKLQNNKLDTASPVPSTESGYGSEKSISPEFNQNNSLVQTSSENMSNNCSKSPYMRKSASSQDLTKNLPKPSQMRNKPSQSAHNSPLWARNEDGSRAFKKSVSFNRRTNKPIPVKRSASPSKLTAAQLAEARSRTKEARKAKSSLTGNSPVNEKNIDGNQTKAKLKRSLDERKIPEKNLPEKPKQVEESKKVNSSLKEGKVLNKKSILEQNNIQQDRRQAEKNSGKTHISSSSGYGSQCSSPESDNVKTMSIEDISAEKSIKYKSKVRMRAGNSIQKGSNRKNSAGGVNDSRSSSSSSDSSSGDDSSSSSDSSDSEPECPQKNKKIQKPKNNNNKKETFTQMLNNKQNDLAHKQVPISHSRNISPVLGKNKLHIEAVGSNCLNNCSKSSNSVQNSHVSQKKEDSTSLNSKQRNSPNKSPKVAADSTDKGCVETANAIASILGDLGNKKAESIQSKIIMPCTKPQVKKHAKTNLSDKFHSTVNHKTAELPTNQFKQQPKRKFIPKQKRVINRKPNSGSNLMKNEGKGNKLEVQPRKKPRIRRLTETSLESADERSDEECEFHCFYSIIEIQSFFYPLKDFVKNRCIFNVVI